MHLNFLDMVQLRIEGESETLKNYLRHEYGVFEEETSQREPDVVINIIDDISSEEKTVHVRGPVSYDDDGVYLQHRLPNEEPEYNAFRIDFDTLGHSTCQVSCDRNFNPHFFGIIVDYLGHFTLLKDGATYCHSCAFEYDGEVVICPAWRQVGKTNLLLSFIQEDVTYIADDWCIITEDGDVHALPKRLNLLYYNFNQYPNLLEKTPEEFQSLVNFVNQAKRGEIDLNQDAIETLSGQARMRISPHDLFNNVSSGEAKPIDNIVFLRREPSKQSPVTSTELSSDEFTYRKQSVLEFEQSYFHTAYQAYKTQTGNVNPYLENAKQRTLDILESIADETSGLYELNAPSQQDSDRMKQVIIDKIIDGEQ